MIIWSHTRCKKANEQILEVTLYQPSHRTSRFKPLSREDDPKDIKSSEEVKMELKPLLSNLRYAFLDSNLKFPFIVNSSLLSDNVDALCDELINHKNVIGYSINDLKGISPNVCMHRILLEDHAKPSIEGQRWINPTLKEVVRKEVTKLLDNGIIYSISDSNWVSPVQVVPKKGGLTVVRNESNDLIPTRTITGWRMCIDYRKLNKATRKDHFQLPFIDQVLERLANFSYFCYLDGLSGFY